MLLLLILIFVLSCGTIMYYIESDSSSAEGEKEDIYFNSILVVKNLMKLFSLKNVLVI